MCLIDASHVPAAEGLLCVVEHMTKWSLPCSGIKIRLIWAYLLSIKLHLHCGMFLCSVQTHKRNLHFLFQNWSLINSTGCVINTTWNNTVQLQTYNLPFIVL